MSRSADSWALGMRGGYGASQPTERLRYVVESLRRLMGIGYVRWLQRLAADGAAGLRS